MESITINSDVENLKVVETVVDTLSKKLGIPDEVYGKILISTVEAVNNAILHGNKGDSKKMVKVDFTADGNVLNVTVTDEGEGFEYSNLPDPTDPKNIENRIKRVYGQVEGVKKMILSGEKGDKVMTQLQACISSLESLKTELIKQQMKTTMVEDVKKSLGLGD